MLPAAFNHLPGIEAATVVSVGRGLYRHVGLLTEPVPGSERRVLSLNPGAPSEQLREETLSEFGRGQPVTLLPPWSDLPAWMVLARARDSVLPLYSWAEFNCEHFVCHAFGVPLESPQLRQFATLAGVVAVAMLVSGAASR
jgi:hypothetical protein